MKIPFKLAITVLIFSASLVAASAGATFKQQYSFTIDRIMEITPRAPFYRYDEQNDRMVLDRRNPKEILGELEIYRDADKTFDSRFEIRAGLGGSGFLMIGGTNTVLCNLKAHIIQNCVSGLEGFKTKIDCAETYWYAGKSFNPHPILKCTRSVSPGSGLYYSSVFFFMNNSTLKYIGSLPKSSYEALSDQIVVEVEITEPDYDNKGMLTACPTLGFSKDLDANLSETKVACSKYRFDPEHRRLEHIGGYEIRNRSVADIYQREFRKLGYGQ